MFLKFLSGKEGWGAETCGKSQEPQWLCKNRVLQDGGATYPSRFDPISGLDDKVGSEGCLPSDTNLSGTSTPTPIPVECQGLSVSMPPVRLNISTTGVYQGIETSSGDTETDGCPSDNLSRRHSDYASEQGGADRTNSFDMSTVQGPGFSGQHEEVPFGSRAIDRVPGFSSEFIDNVFDPPSPEATEDPARCLKALETGDCVSKGTGKVPGKGINGSKSSVASSPSLQGTPGNGKCSFAREPNPTRPDTKVQCAGTTNQRSKRGFDLVDLSRQHSNRIPHVPSYSTVDDRIRCIQHRLGSSSRGPDHRGSVVEGGSNTPYQLPGTPSSLSSSTVFCERAAPNNHSVEVGQYNCNDLHQQNGGNTVIASVSIGPLLMGVVSAEGDILSSSASARERECSGRSGVQNSEGSLRLDAEPQCIQANSSTNGSLRGGFVCISPNQTTTTVLQLEAGSRSKGSGCVQSGLVSSKGFCQPPVVPDSSLPGSVKEAESQDSVNHSSVEHPTLVSSSAGAIRRLSQTATPAGRSCEMPNSTRVYNESKGSRPNCMAHLRESFAS